MILITIAMGSSFISFSNAQQYEEVKCPSVQSIKSIKTPLRFRNTNNDIKIFQQALVCLGYLEEDGITGYYGRMTAEALRNFCEDENFKCSGRVLTRTIKHRLSEVIAQEENDAVVINGKEMDLDIKQLESISIGSGGMPDLAPVSFNINPSPLEPGKPVTYSYSVANKGTVTAYNVAVRLINVTNGWSMGGITLSQLTPNQILPYGDVRDSSPFWATCSNNGLNVVRIVVDPDNKIKESDETNNTLDFPVMLKGCGDIK